jgi:hypothetical protein
MTRLKVMTDRNVSLNFMPLEVAAGLNGSKTLGVKVRKDALTGLLRPNQKCFLTLENNDRLAGKITGISPETNTESLTFKIAIR